MQCNASLSLNMVLATLELQNLWRLQRVLVSRQMEIIGVGKLVMYLRTTSFTITYGGIKNTSDAAVREFVNKCETRTCGC